MQYIAGIDEQERVLFDVQLAISAADADAADADEAFDLDTINYDEWEEGTEGYADFTIEEMVKDNALPDQHLPFFNHYQDPEGIRDAWSPGALEALKKQEMPLETFRHQWLGVQKGVDNMLSGRNLLLMDQVGVGKTMQAIGMIAMYEWLRQYFAKHSSYPPRYGEVCFLTTRA